MRFLVHRRRVGGDRTPRTLRKNFARRMAPAASFGLSPHSRAKSAQNFHSILRGDNIEEKQDCELNIYDITDFINPRKIFPLEVVKVVIKKISIKLNIYRASSRVARARVRELEWVESGIPYTLPRHDETTSAAVSHLTLWPIVETMLNEKTQQPECAMTSKVKLYHLGVRLDKQTRADLVQAAKEERRCPSDLARLMIIDSLDARKKTIR